MTEAKRKPGRPPDIGVRRDSKIEVRATPDEAAAFKAVGVERFRRWLRAAHARLKGGAEPKA
ncbi:MAG TPA: hypothetical protein PKB14_25470 [Rubrivivax sp.]|nr:hypothetical protein [Rubrivivax sp.]